MTKLTEINSVIKTIVNKMPNAKAIKTSKYDSTVASAYLPGEGFIVVGSPFNDQPEFADMDEQRLDAIYFISEKVLKNNITPCFEFLENNNNLDNSMPIYSISGYNPFFDVLSPVTEEFNPDGEQLTLTSHSIGNYQAKVTVFEKHSDAAVMTSINIGALLDYAIVNSVDDLKEVGLNDDYDVLFDSINIDKLPVSDETKQALREVSQAFSESSDLDNSPS